jgi:uncharacterized membrane protein
MSEPGVPPPPSYTPPPPPPPGGSGGQVSPNRTLMIVLSYLGLLALIPLLVEKDDQEVQWHAKNGLVLFGAEIIFWIAIRIISHAILRSLGCIGCIAAMGLGLVNVAPLALNLIGIIKGTKGQRFVIPVLSDFVDRF